LPRKNNNLRAKATTKRQKSVQKNETKSGGWKRVLKRVLAWKIILQYESIDQRRTVIKPWIRKEKNKVSR
jgi:hypothetical protein